MINREEAIKFLNEKIKNKNIIKHMLATEALMRSLARKLKVTRPRPDEVGKNEKLKINEEEWGIAGLLHDGDYCEEVPVEKQGVQVTEWLREEGHEIPENVAQTMAAHNWQGTGVEPKTLMDWSLFIGDSLTGLIVACALVRPDKKLASVTIESVMRKFKDKAFARGTRREDVKICEEKLGLSLEEFVKISLEAMQGISKELGL